ncbi:MAG: nucleotide sugar dehydrogenase [Candidatus Rokubacteria bacterium]|nr:nucleotide sugar dehydrogenase [Candidatus Rokubacteria bacterium]MBI3105849.1 nucleotide sugar dehydrogenase [Candidatus Rokubacteria bacterium]
MTAIGVVGLGYVGLTLAVTLCRKGFAVHGMDASPDVLAALGAGRPHLFEPGVEEGLRRFLGERLHVGSALPAGGLDAAILCVSTPVSPDTHAPELGNLRLAARHIAERCGEDTLVIVRSTVPVGATREVVLPELRARWARPRLAFAPERTIQGQALRELEELPQVVGGLDAESRERAVALFARVTRRVVLVASLETAELVKLVNNCHTDLIYSYGNEVALIAERFRLDPLEVIRAANLDYPRPDLASPGFVGGGCLSKDPYILLSAATRAGYAPWLVGQARGLNERLPLHVAERLVALIRETRGRAEGARLCVLGWAYKGWPPTDDMRGTPIVPMLPLFRAAGLALRGHDFLVRGDVIAGLGATPVTLEAGFDGADAVLVVTNHPDYARADLPKLLGALRRPAVLYDCWRILGEEAARAAGVRYAGIGYG